MNRSVNDINVFPFFTSELFLPEEKEEAIQTVYKKSVFSSVFPWIWQHKTKILGGALALFSAVMLVKHADQTKEIFSRAKEELGKAFAYLMNNPATERVIHDAKAVGVNFMKVLGRSKEQLARTFIPQEGENVFYKYGMISAVAYGILAIHRAITSVISKSYE